MKITPAKFLKGTIRLPGDKSISHRAALFAALAEGETRIENFATSADCDSTLSCLENLGVRIRRDKSTVFIKGVGKSGFRQPNAPLDCGNSGTTMRLLAGALAGQNFDSVLIGDESLSRRPMRRIIEPLRLMGAHIDSANDGAPLRIYGRRPLKAISYDMPVASAQIKSCLLLAGLNAEGTTEVRSPASGERFSPSRNHTELMFRYLGAAVGEEFIESPEGFIHSVSVDGGARLFARDLNVPADISSAAFFLVAASCLKNSDLTLKTVGLNRSRRGVIDVLRRFGARIDVSGEAEIGNEAVGDLRVSGDGNLASTNGSNRVGGDVIANIIDEIPALAVFGTQLAGGLEIRDAGELRVKESDRIKAVVENLRRMNADVEEFPDGLRVGHSRLQGAGVDSFGDHRIAMAFAVAALLATGETKISGAETAAISFPEFFDVLSSATFR